MQRPDLMMYLPLFALLVWAAIEDLRSRRIPNWLTFALALGGIVSSVVFARPLGVGDAMLGMLVGFALPFILFSLGALGGGDVKLLAAVGVWFGPAGAFHAFVIAAVVGLVIVVTQSLIQRRTRVLFRNSAVVALNLVHMSDVGVEQAIETGKSSRSVDRPLPYAVPVLVAALLLIVM